VIQRIKRYKIQAHWLPTAPFPLIYKLNCQDSEMPGGIKTRKQKIGSPGRSVRSQARATRLVRSPEPLISRPIIQELSLCALLFICTFVVYWPALKNSFVNYDDPDYVTDNAHIFQGLNLSTVEWAFRSTVAANWHPLTWLSHALDYQLFGVDPWGHHFTSVFLHCGNVALVFLLLLRATDKTAPSFFAAGLFALHPLNVECVAWVAERKSVLSMFFFLLALGAYGWYAHKPSSKRYLAMAGLFVFALMAKPMAVTFPFVLMLIDVWPLRRVAGWSPHASGNEILQHEMPRSEVPRFPATQLIREKLPLIALAALSCVITLVAQRPALKAISAIPFRERLANAIYSYPMYLWRALWPARLGVFYSPQGAHLHTGQITLYLVFLITVSTLVWLARARVYPLIGWLWFLGTLVPMIGIVQVGEQGMADRYAYLPLLGIFVAVSFGIADLRAGRRIFSWMSVSLACVALLVLSATTRRQIATWESSYALWSHSLEITKDNYVAEDFVGFSLLESGSALTGEGCVEDAFIHFRRAVSINPQDALGLLNVGFCEQVRGQLQEAVVEYKAAAEFARSKFLRNKAYTNLGSAYEDLRDFSNARDAYENALEIFPNDGATAARLKNLELNNPGLSSPGLRNMGHR
jgi:protein O-mannosyl-transferase